MAIGAFAAFVLAAAAPAAPTGAQVTAATPASIQARAERLAEAVTPRARFVALEVSGARQGFEAGVASDPDASAQDRAMFKAVWAAAEPEFRRSSDAGYPALIAQLANVYAKRLNAAEIDALLHFYATPTGQKLIAAMYANVDLSPVLDEFAGQEQPKVSAGAVAEVQDRARERAVEQITPADHPALEALGRSVDMAKMHAVAAEVQSLTMNWINKEDPEFDARLQKIMEKAMTDYMAKGGKGR